MLTKRLRSRKGPGRNAKPPRWAGRRRRKDPCEQGVAELGVPLVVGCAEEWLDPGAEFLLNQDMHGVRRTSHLLIEGSGRFGVPAAVAGCVRWDSGNGPTVIIPQSRNHQDGAGRSRTAGAGYGIGRCL